MKTNSLNQNLFNRFKVEKSKMETLKGGLQDHGPIVESVCAGCGADAVTGMMAAEYCGVHADGTPQPVYVTVTRCA